MSSRRCLGARPSRAMAGDKLAATEACAAYLVRRLVPYDDAVDLVAPLASVP